MAPAAPSFGADESERSSRFECCFRVIGVRSNDQLNIRAEPANLRTKVGTIPYDGTGIGVAQCVRIRRNNSVWCMIQYGGTIGWVAARFLDKQR